MDDHVRHVSYVCGILFCCHKWYLEAQTIYCLNLSPIRSIDPMVNFCTLQKFRYFRGYWCPEGGNKVLDTWKRTPKNWLDIRLTEKLCQYKNASFRTKFSICYLIAFVIFQIFICNKLILNPFASPSVFVYCISFFHILLDNIWEKLRLQQSMITFRLEDSCKIKEQVGCMWWSSHVLCHHFVVVKKNSKWWILFLYKKWFCAGSICEV